jgi:beta-galactosidase/beta-glucuronidase
MNLNGSWQFAFDDANAGLNERWFEGRHVFDRTIQVPFAFQSELSCVHDTGFHDWVWYQRQFSVPTEWAGKRLLLHFGAVDYRAWVWVNGILAVYHQGGHTPFSAEITSFLNAGENTITVRVEDVSTDLGQPRGKQYWEKESKSIFYTRTTGIWQTVWLEAVADVYIERLKITPDIDAGELRLEYTINGAAAKSVQIETEITFDGQPVFVQPRPAEVQANTVRQTIALGGTLHLWSPESPNLYDLIARIHIGGALYDEVHSYFGMRKISIEDGRVLLNNHPYYMKLVLDQGYNPLGVLTFPTDDDIRRDVELTKAMGFNGARKHQKVEEPRYLYWADRLGLLVWGEMANAYDYSEVAVSRITAEWQEAVMRDYNHPCIVVWVPLNESWGVPALYSDARQPQHLAALYHLTRSLDTTRPVVSNDGWEHARTDLLTIHDYEGKKAVLKERYATLDGTVSARPANRHLYSPGHLHQGEPILMTEFGGIGYKKGAQEGWGYTTARDDEDFARRYEAVISAMYESPLIQGYCYTQLTDVEQEINGLLTYDRQPKIDLEIIRRINDARA